MKITSVVDVLIVTANLVERGWTQGELARDAADRPVDPRALEAVSWAADGALYRACGGDRNLYNSAYEVVWKTFGGGLAAWNDAAGRAQSDVVQGLRRAATAAWENPDTSPVMPKSAARWPFGIPPQPRQRGVVVGGMAPSRR